MYPLIKSENRGHIVYGWSRKSEMSRMSRMSRMSGMSGMSGMSRMSGMSGMSEMFGKSGMPGMFGVFWMSGRSWRVQRVGRLGRFVSIKSSHMTLAPRASLVQHGSRELKILKINVSNFNERNMLLAFIISRSFLVK